MTDYALQSKAALFSLLVVVCAIGVHSFGDDMAEGLFKKYAMIKVQLG